MLAAKQMTEYANLGEKRRICESAFLSLAHDLHGIGIYKIRGIRNRKHRAVSLGS